MQGASFLGRKKVTDKEIIKKAGEFSANENSGKELVEFLKRLCPAETKEPLLRYNGLLGDVPKFVVYETKVSNSFCNAWGSN